MSDKPCTFKISCETRSILIGWYKYLLTDSKELIKSRTDMCKRCPISKKANGKYSGWCRTSNGGCGCHLKAKAAYKEEWCDLAVWGPDTLSEGRLKEVQEEFNA